MAVYTEVNDADLIDFLASYSIGKLLSCKGIAEGVENSNYFLHTESGSFILTLYEKRVEERELPFFLSLMEHLAESGLSCPQPVKNKAGEALGRLAGRPAAIVTFLDGYAIHHPESQHCAALGEALARLHLAGAGFKMKRKNTLSINAWRPLFSPYAERASEISDELRDFVEKELNLLEQNWPENLPLGVIHADLFPDNVFFLGNRISGFIDFYFACCDALAYDLAICLNAWCFDSNQRFQPASCVAIINAYQSVRKLTENEIQAFPWLVRGAAMRFLLTRFVDWLNVPKGALVRPKDPREYLNKLRFHQTMTSFKDYGLSS